MGLLSVATFVRLFGYEQYGRYAVSLSIVMTLSAWAAGWLSPGVLRFSSTYCTSERAQRFRRTVIACTAMSMSVAGIVVGVGLRMLVDKSWRVDLIAAFLAATIVAYTVTLATLQARLRSAAVVKMEATRTVLTFVTPVTIVWLMNATHYSVLLVGALGGYLLPILVYMMNGSRISSPAIRVPDSAAEALREARHPGLALLWAFGWPVALWTLTNQGLTVSDRFLVQHFQGYAQAGIYASVYDIVVRSFSLIFFPITLATHPIIMKHWNGGERSTALAVIRTSIKYQIWLCLPVLAGLGLFGPSLIRALLGPRAAQATPLVMPLALGGCVWQLSLLIHKPLGIMCRTQQMLSAMATIGYACRRDWLAPSAFGPLLWVFYLSLPLIAARDYSVSGNAVWKIAFLLSSLQLGALAGEGIGRQIVINGGKGTPRPAFSEALALRLLWMSGVCALVAMIGTLYLAFSSLSVYGLQTSIAGLLGLGPHLAAERYVAGRSYSTVTRALLLWPYPAALLGGLSYPCLRSRRHQL